MGTPVARVGDTIDHGGEIISGSPTRTFNGIPAARVGDQVMCSLHGLQTITTGSPPPPAGYTVNGLALARVGSLCSCGATIVSGSPNWTVT